MENKFECPLCLDHYKDPRILSCFHTYCRDCLETYVSKTQLTDNPVATLACPICRATFALPEGGVDGLQKNFYLEESFEKKAKPSHPTCGLHTGEDLRFYCRDCAEPICRDCKIIAHDGHRIDMLDNVAAEMRVKLTEVIDTTEKCINENEIQLRTTTETEIQDLETTISDITKHAEQMKREIDCLLTYSKSLITPHIKSKKKKVFCIQTQSDNKLEKLCDYKKLFSQADKQSENHSNLKVYKELIEKEDDIKMLKKPLSPSSVLLCDPLDTLMLKSSFCRLRDILHLGIVQFKNSDFSNEDRGHSGDISAPSVKRHPSLIPCSTQSKIPRMSDSIFSFMDTKTTPEVRPQTPERMVPVLKTLWTASINPNPNETMTTASQSNIAQPHIPTIEVKRQPEILSNKIESICNLTSECKSDALPKVSYQHDQDIQPINRSNSTTHNISQTGLVEQNWNNPHGCTVIEGSRVQLKGGGNFEVGQISAVRQNKSGDIKKMRWAGREFVEMKQNSKTAVRRQSSDSSGPTTTEGNYQADSTNVTGAPINVSVETLNGGRYVGAPPTSSRPRCRDFDERGYCVRDLCMFDHSTDPVVVDPEKFTVPPFPPETVT